MSVNNTNRLNSIKDVLTDFLRNPGEGLYQRTVRSGIWVFTLRIFERVLGIVKLVILPLVILV